MKMKEMAATSLCWAKSVQTQSFKTGDMHIELRDNGTPVYWRQIISNNYARPRACFILWLALWNRLPTKDRLEKINVVTDGLCVFCGQIESINHLFFVCRHSQVIWQTMLNWLGYTRASGDWIQESSWVSLEVEKKGWKRKILKMITAEVVYLIWQDRNGRIFNKHNQNCDLVALAKYMVISRAIRRKELARHVNLESLVIS
ncbi:uncharacterized protein LOC131606041 [Vicia villosa]|uniref:uncharacterized protein LOC131606041 n=1 Tax=Vicia villosa TaxID=3911 RepID=UPI00273B0430|nr:uncharacterized protein LOC131606041 [Vicia villosa]